MCGQSSKCIYHTVYYVVSGLLVTNARGFVLERNGCRNVLEPLIFVFLFINIARLLGS